MSPCSVEDFSSSLVGDLLLLDATVLLLQAAARGSSAFGLLVLHGSLFKLGFFFLGGAVEMNGDLFTKLGVDILLLVPWSECVQVYPLECRSRFAQAKLQQRTSVERTYQASSLCLRAHEIDKNDVKRSWNDQHQEELPADLVERNRAGNEENNVGQIQTGHADSHALATNVGRKDFGAGGVGINVSIHGGYERRAQHPSPRQFPLEI